MLMCSLKIVFGVLSYYFVLLFCTEPPVGIKVAVRKLHKISDACPHSGFFVEKFGCLLSCAGGRIKEN